MNGSDGPAPGRSGEDWYRRWFGEEYLRVYPHRDREEARRAVELFRDVCAPREGARILDLACGAGRHLEPLVRAGFRPVGLDLSAPLLRRARGEEPGVPLVRGDMRAIPFSDASFACVVQFFTSFGYFGTREEDERVLREIRRVLRRDGCFLVDFLNAEQVRRTLVPRDEREVDGRRVRQTRWIEEGRVHKRIEIEPVEDPGSGEVFHERVRLYEPGELDAMMADAGLEVRARRGDYHGAGYDETSPRLLLAGTPA